MIHKLLFTLILCGCAGTALPSVTVQPPSDASCTSTVTVSLPLERLDGGRGDQ